MSQTLGSSAVRQYRDFWVDGHYIAAYTPEDALREVKAIYNHDAEQVRPWTQDDQDALDEIYDGEV